MTLVDEIDLFAQSGSGGSGVVRWHNSRMQPRGGPAGGDGGRGGDVVLRAVRDANRLSKYRGNTSFVAENGGNGGGNSLHGKNGDDVVIELPVGSVVTYADKKVELMTEGEEVVLLVGGAGGFGNEHFKGSRNVSPEESTEGKSGISATLHVELKLIADLGLVGYPNAGKSSLLNTLTNAKSKVGNYAFTTLDPHLGDLYGYIIADIPGIIEGASEGRGLGHKFLRHIARTKLLLFCISVEQDDPISAYRALENELISHDEHLGSVSRAVVLTKSDLVPEDVLEEKLTVCRELGVRVFVLSVLDDERIKKFTEELLELLRSEIASKEEASGSV